MSALAEKLAVESLAELATLPYRRGAEVQAIALGADVGGWTTVPAYDFRQYKARWGEDPPAPRYLLAATFDVGPEPLALEVELDRGGPLQVVSLTLPPRTPAGLSFAVPLADDDDATLRLRRLRAASFTLPGPGAQSFRLVALLGNLSKLLWVVGRGQDELAALLGSLPGQRQVRNARGASLDLLGRDLRVPRFPARAYSFDPDTLALYHFDEHPVADGAPFADETKRFGLPGHPATAHGAVSGGRGKLGRGLSLPGGTGNGSVEIPSHGDFDLPAGTSRTVELFARVDGASAVRVLVAKGQLDAAGELAADGWSLTLGSFRGIANNPRFAARVAGQSFAAFADLDLADGRFHHLAASLDRARGRLRLYLDGELKAESAFALGAVANAQPVRVGRSNLGHALSGILDELRFSALARSEFAPVLGEGDEAYRRRLAIFERWLLPSPKELLAALNSAVEIAGDPEPLVLVEKDRPLARALATTRLVPGSLPAGTGIDLEGNVRGSVEAACGRPEDEPKLPPELFFRHDDARATYASEAGRRMQAPLVAALEELLARLPVGPDKLAIDAAYDPEGEGLQRVGRALFCHHPTVGAGELAALAHRAGFGWVENRGARVFAAVAAGHRLTVEVVPPAPAEQPPGGDLFTGKLLDLSVGPVGLPAATRLTWRLVRCGKGRAHFEGHPADAALRTPIERRTRLRLVADGQGEIVVTVEGRLGGTTSTGARTFRIVPQDVADGASLAADGDATLTEEAAVGTPESGFNPAFLVPPTSAVSFAPDPNAKKLSVALDRALERLVGLLGLPPAQLTVNKAFVPGDPGLPGVARALRLVHAAVPPGALASLAHQSGFGFVKRLGAEVYASVPAGDPLEIVQVAGGAPLPAEIVLGVPLNLKIRQAPLPAGTLNWSLDGLPLGQGKLSTVLRPQTTFTAQKAGRLALTAFHLGVDPEATFPFSFEVRLKPALEGAGTVIPKPEYDLLMNLLNYFHPLGTEVLTRRLREHVVEVKDNLLSAFPGYTYPDFRI